MKGWEETNRWMCRSEEEDQEHEEEQSDADDDDEAGDESSDNDSLPALVDVPLPPTPPNAAAAAVAPAAPAAVPSAAKNCAASGSSAAAPAAAMASTSSASAAVPAPAVYETSYKMELEGWDDKSPFVPVDEFRGTRQKLPDHRNASRCEHFDRHGWCKVGEGCTLRHETGWSVTSNLSGLPIRRDKKVRMLFSFAAVFSLSVLHSIHSAVEPAVRFRIQLLFFSTPLQSGRSYYTVFGLLFLQNHCAWVAWASYGAHYEQDTQCAHGLYLLSTVSTKSHFPMLGHTCWVC